MSTTHPPVLRRARRHHRSLVAGLAALALLTAACGGSSDSTDEGNTDDTSDSNALEDEGEPQDGGQLTVAVNAETDGWNPGVNNWADAGNVVGSTVLETLMAFNAEGEAEPYLASGITSNDDFTEWTVTLPDDVTFHDGTPLTAQIVADNLNFYAHGPTLAKVALDAIFGTVEAVDETTVRIPLNVSWSALPASLAGPSGYIMAPAMLDEANGYNVDSPIGTGPFEFESWTPDESFSVTKFEDYRVEGEPHLDGIDFQVIVDAGSRQAALEAGDAQMIYTTSADTISAARERPGTTIVEDLDSEKSFIQLNTSQPPFDDPIAREAVAYATNRDEVAEVLGGGIVSQTDDPFNGRWKVDEPGYVEFDPAKAEELVAQYESESGQELSFRLSGLNTVDERTLMDLLAEQWEAVGMTVEIQQVEQTVYISEAVGGQFQAQSFRSFGYLDPDSSYVFWHSSTATPPISINFTQMKDPVIDEALDAARQTDVFEERKELYDEVARQLNSQFTHIWLYNTPYAIVADEVVKGLNPARTIPFGNFLPKTWWGGIWLDQS